MVRGSLGDVTLTKSATKGTYPLYAMQVPTLLSLDRWEPHQDLVLAGKVVEMTPELLKEKDVIFVSHQWTAFNHPDPMGEQLRALQLIINNLLTGKHSVESNFWLNTVYGTLERLTPEMWQARLPEMFVWFDYISSASSRTCHAHVSPTRAPCAPTPLSPPYALLTTNLLCPAHLITSLLCPAQSHSPAR